MTDAKRKANILSVYNKLGLSPPQAEGLDEADMTEEADTTKKAVASTPKDAIDIDSDDDKDNEATPTQQMVVMLKTATHTEPCLPRY